MSKNTSIEENKKMIEKLSLQIKNLEMWKFDQSKLDKLEEEIFEIKQKIPDMNERNLKLSTEINTLMSKNQDSEIAKEKIKLFP